MRSIRYHYLNMNPELFSIKEKSMQPTATKPDPAKSPHHPPQPSPNKNMLAFQPLADKKIKV